MANPEPPVISTPSRPRHSLSSKKSGSFTAAKVASPSVAGFSPGGQVFEGYSYLSRSSSISTTTRSRPKGLQSRHSDVFASPTLSISALPSSPSSPHIPVPSSPSRANRQSELPQRRSTIHKMPTSVSSPDLNFSAGHLPRSSSEFERLAEAVSDLPLNPKVWIPSQVALYLTHVLGLVPRPLVEDVTAYVRSSRMGGRAFLRLSEKELERQGLNLKWRKLMIEAVRKLRRDALRGRIWGNDADSLKWPKTAEQLAHDEGDDDDASLFKEDDGMEKDGIVRNSKTTSKLTLKRMRDSRKVRGMIQAFQRSPQVDGASVTTSPIEAIYPEGYVREQAVTFDSEAEQKALSLRRPLRPRRSTADFPWLAESATDEKVKRKDIEALLASLSQQEAEDLASELGLQDLKDSERVLNASQAKAAAELRREGSSESAIVAMVPTLARYQSEEPAFGGDSSVSEYSGTDSELDTPDQSSIHESDHKPRYGLLDEETIRAIMAEETDDSEGKMAPSSAENKSKEAEASMTPAVELGQLKRSHTTASIVRPEHPYRASLYTQEELHVLQSSPMHIRTESSQELVQSLLLDDAAGQDDLASPKFGTAKLRVPEERGKLAAASPVGDQTEPTAQTDGIPAVEAEYVFEVPVSASKAIPKGGSISQRGSKATFGSKRGKAFLSALNRGEVDGNDLFSNLPGARASATGSMSLRRKKSDAKNLNTAEDEEGWGGTVGRTSLRKGLASVFLNQAASDATPAALSIGRSKVGSMAFRKRNLERVASEAEAEALHANMDRLERQEDVPPAYGPQLEATHQPVEIPVDRYEESPVTAQCDDEAMMQRRPSLEQRLSSLFVSQQEVVDQDEQEELKEAVSAVCEAPLEMDESLDVQHGPTGHVEDGTPQLQGHEVQTTAEVTIPATTDEESTASEEGLSDRQEQSIESMVVAPEAETSAQACLSPAPVMDEKHEKANFVMEDPVIAEVPNHATMEPEAEAEDARVGHSDQAGAIELKTTTVEEDVPASSMAKEDRSKLLVPLTVLEPHPSGTGSIKKRSMVLVDRKRFESLARRMTELESQLDSLDQLPSSPSVPASMKSSVGLRDLFENKGGGQADEEADLLEKANVWPSSEDFLPLLEAASSSKGAGSEPEIGAVPTAPVPPPSSEQTTARSPGWRSYVSPTSWAKYLSSLNPYYSEASAAAAVVGSSVGTLPKDKQRGDNGQEEEEELSLYALLGREESDYEKQLLSIGAIPAYMLGLGAGVGFVLVREVLGKSLMARR